MLKWLHYSRSVPCGFKFRQFSSEYATPNPRNHLYNVLKVTPNSSQQQIKTAYYKLCQRYHPDKTFNADVAAANHVKFTEITEAYKILSDPKTKRAYDRDQQVVRSNTPYNPGQFTQSEINRHNASASQGRKHDEWTRGHYRDQLDLRDYREQRDRMRRTSTEAEEGDARARFTVFSLCFITFILGQFAFNYRERRS